MRIQAESGRTFGGYSADADIVVASVKAYLAAVNRMIAAAGYGGRTPEGEVAAYGVAHQRNGLEKFGQGMPSPPYIESTGTAAGTYKHHQQVSKGYPQ